ncbi:MAG: hypothetical protein WBA89_04095 [Microcoleus sp.]
MDRRRSTQMHNNSQQSTVNSQQSTVNKIALIHLRYIVSGCIGMI